MHDKIKAASTSCLVVAYLNATMCLEKPPIAFSRLVLNLLTLAYLYLRLFANIVFIRKD